MVLLVLVGSSGLGSGAGRLSTSFLGGWVIWVSAVSANKPRNRITKILTHEQTQPENLKATYLVDDD